MPFLRTANQDYTPAYARAADEWRRNYMPAPHCDYAACDRSLPDQLFINQGVKLGSDTRLQNSDDPLTYSFRKGTFAALHILTPDEDEEVMKALTKKNVISKFPRQIVGLGGAEAALDGVRIGVFHKRSLNSEQKMLVLDILAAYDCLVRSRAQVNGVVSELRDAMATRLDELQAINRTAHFDDYDGAYAQFENDQRLNYLCADLSDAEDNRAAPPSKMVPPQLPPGYAWEGQWAVQNGEAGNPAPL